MGVYDGHKDRKGGAKGMRTITLRELDTMYVQLRELWVFPENWSHSVAYLRYKDAPRPTSGLFIVCTDVEARFYPKDRPVVTAGKGDVVFIPRGVHYHAEVLGGKNDRIDTYTLNLQLVSPEGEELLLSDEIAVIATRQDDLFAIRAAAVSGAVHRVGQPGTLKVQAALYHLLDALSASAQEDAEDHYLIRPGCEALRSEWNQNRKIEEYAAMCGMSPAYFYRCFRRYAGKSPVEYRNQIRLLNAETMLRHTEIRVGEIAKAVGFSDPFYFCRIFAAAYGLSPRRYRDSFRNQTEKSTQEGSL